MVVKSFYVHQKSQNMFNLGESGTWQLLMQPDHILLGHFDMQCSRIQEKPELHRPYDMERAPVLLASTPEFLHIFRPLTTDIA